MSGPTRGQIVTFLSYLYLAALGSYLLYTSYGLVGAIVGFVVAIPAAPTSNPKKNTETKETARLFMAV